MRLFFLLTPSHVSLHVNLPFFVDTVSQRTRSSIYDSMKVVKYLFLRPIVDKVVMNIYVESESAFREEANGADKRTVCAM